MNVKTLIVLCFALLVGCGPKKEFLNQGPSLNHPLNVFTYGTNQEIAKKIRLVHGRQLSEKLSQKGWFNSVEYQGDGKDIASLKTTLRITQVFVQQGLTEFPLELKFHYMLEHEGEMLFNQVYGVEANQLNRKAICAQCPAEEVALKMLEQKLMPELQARLNRLNQN